MDGEGETEAAHKATVIRFNGNKWKINGEDKRKQMEINGNKWESTLQLLVDNNTRRPM